MRSSPWTILVLGVLAFAFVAVGMLMMLSRYSDSPAGNRAKIANEIRDVYRFEGVVVDRRKEGKLEVLRVEYQTGQDLLGDASAMETQMAEVGLKAYERCEEKEKEELDRIHVFRHQVTRSGCSKQVSTREHRMKNPRLEQFFQ